jgi:hypothetical protein
MNAANIAFQALSAIFAVLAAILWFQASREKPVTQVLQEVERLGGPDIFGSYFVEIVRTLINQSKLNTRAASCTALSAMCQAFGIVTSILSPM